MLKPTNPAARSSLLAIAIAFVQLFDIVIHAATNQIEPLRVTANVLIFLWLAVVMSGRLNTQFLQTAVGSIGGYLILNTLFLALEGVTNAEQGGELRWMLFLLIFLTVALSTLLTYTRGKLIVG